MYIALDAIHISLLQFISNKIRTIGGAFMPQNDLDKLIQKLDEIKLMGWIENRRHGNHGGVGNTLEDLLEVAENNLQLPDFGKWEIKSQRAETSSLLTLFHCEPKPRDLRFVPRIALLKYGWAHQEAGSLYSDNEMSFRQTINALTTSDRGFLVNVDRLNQKIFISFNASKIAAHHNVWKKAVESRIGLNDLNPHPYWDFSDLAQKLTTKLKNTIFVQAETKREISKESYHYRHFEVYTGLDIENFISLIEEGQIYVDFDARTGHNHGTKFRIRSSAKYRLYSRQIEV